MKEYTTEGSVRGTCGHIHRSLSTAIQCMQHDETNTRRQGGYSDRQVKRIGAKYSDRSMDLVELDENEIEEYHRIQEAVYNGEL